VTSADRHADRTAKRLQRRGPDGRIVLTYASARTARKAETAMNARHANVKTTLDANRRAVTYELIDAERDA